MRRLTFIELCFHSGILTYFRNEGEKNTTFPQKKAPATPPANKKAPQKTGFYVDIGGASPPTCKQKSSAIDSQSFKSGGANRSRTDLKGFAVLCLAAWLSRLKTPISIPHPPPHCKHFFRRIEARTQCAHLKTFREGYFHFLEERIVQERGVAKTDNTSFPIERFCKVERRNICAFAGARQYLRLIPV